MIETETPGKLMLAGEWAVLELGVPCIVMAIDKKVSVELEPCETISVFAPDLNLEKKEASFNGQRIEWIPALNRDEKEKLLMAEHAIQTTLLYLKEKRTELKKFSIITGSEDCVIDLPDGTRKKIGFGSSAAAVVGIVKAILNFHDIETNNQEALELVYKLSCMAHFEAQGKVGSSFDVAASTFGGILIYKRFDPKWLQERAEAGKNIAEITESEWPSLQLEPIQKPQELNLLIGYTGPDTSTKEMIKKVQACKAEKKEEYWKTINEIKKIVEELIPAMQNNEKEKIVALLQKNRITLQELAKVSGIELETQNLGKLADIAEQNHCAGKLSGAGGGGLGIAVCFDSYKSQVIEAEWKKAGIEPVKASIAPKTTQ